jgi:hypothetical protein
LNEGISSEELTKVIEGLKEKFLVKKSGFMKRTITVFDKDIWTNIIFW